MTTRRFTYDPHLREYIVNAELAADGAEVDVRTPPESDGWQTVWLPLRVHSSELGPPLRPVACTCALILGFPDGRGGAFSHESHCALRVAHVASLQEAPERVRTGTFCAICGTEPFGNVALHCKCPSGRPTINRSATAETQPREKST